MKVKATNSDRMVFTTEDGEEYPLFDESNDSSLLNKMLELSQNTINELKERIWTES